MFDPEAIRNILRELPDPEIPTVSLVDLGVVQDICTNAEGKLCVELVPTFAGCPAIGFMRLSAEELLRSRGYANAEVVINSRKCWSSDMLTDVGRTGLLKHGLALPPPASALDTGSLPPAACPKCSSENTVMMSPFGPTLCRAIHHCRACGETFEQFKPI